jgi:excisionase family DNA binding protein
MTTQLISTRQAAELLGVHPVTVRKWVRQGLLGAIRLPGPRGQIRIPIEELERLRDSAA